MKKSSMRKLLTIIGCIVLIAALALMATGCGSKEEPTTPTETKPAPTAAMEVTVTEDTVPEEGEIIEVPFSYTVLGEGATSFTLIVGDMEGNETSFLIQTDETTVGAALMAVDLLKGEDGPYGLYIHEVNGIRAVYEEDGTYWAFYENGEYAMTGVDLTEINPDTVYSLVKTKG